MTEATTGAGVERRDDEPEGKRLRTYSSASTGGEGPRNDVDIPLPTADGEYQESEFETLSEPAAKRTRFDIGCSDPGLDPAEPVEEVGMIATVAAAGVPLVDRPGKFDLCEVFSPPRTVVVAKENGLRGGWSLDIRHEDGTTGRSWDLSRREEMDSVFELLRRDKPFMVTLSPPCTKFCALLRLCRKDVDRKEWLQAVRFVNFAVRVAKHQLENGRHFIFEHPLTASSWRLPSLVRLRKAAGVYEGVLHMCQYGLTSRDAAGEAPARKATRILTSSVAVRDLLLRKCLGDHRHVQLISGRPAAAQEYPYYFSEAIVHGTELELVKRAELAARGEVLKDDVRGAKAADRLLGLEGEEAEGKLLWESRGGDDHVPAAGCEACDGYFEAVNGSYIDDVTGLPLPAEMVQTGRREELEGFAKRTVYEVRSRAWAEAQGYPIFGTRWVDRMKGGKVRSRLCVQEFNTKKGKMGSDELFAPTPPLVAARYAVSRSASSMAMPRSMRRRLMAIDFEKAFLNGRMARHVCVRLPPEDARAQGGTNVGYLNRAMYGLRDAPVIWQEVVANLMFELHVTAIRTVPCV